jgi:hypothetical protein
MPTVQTYGQQKVATAALPGVRKTAAETPQSEGLAVAQADESRAQAIEGIGTQALKVSSQAQTMRDEAVKQANQLAFLSADTQLGMWQNQREAEAYSVRGKDSFGLPESVGGEFNLKADEIAGTLSNNDQRIAFEKSRAQRAQELDLRMRRHVTGEMSRYETQELGATVENSQNTAIQNATDPHQVAIEIDRQATAIQIHGAHLGLGPEEIKKTIGDAKSKTHVGVIEQLLASEHDEDAQSYFDAATKKGEINGDQIPRLVKGLEEGKLRKQSQQISDTIMAGTYGVRASGEAKGQGYFGALKRPGGGFSSELSIGVEIDGKEMEIPSLVPGLTAAETQQMLALKPGEQPPTSVIAKAIAHARERLTAGKSVWAQVGEQDVKANPEVARTTPEAPEPPTLNQALEQARAITDPKLRDQVEQRIEHRFAQNKQGQLETDEQAMKLSLNQLDASHGDLHVIPPTTWASFDDPKRRALMAYSEAIQRGVQPATDWTAYYAAKGRADDDPQAFAKENLLLMRGKLADSEFKQLVDIQSSIRDKKPPHPDLLEFRTKEQILNDELTRYGFETEPSKQSPQQKQAVAQLRRMADERLLALSTVKGSKPDNTDIQKTLDYLLTQTKETKGSFRALWPGSGVPLSGVRGSNKRLIDLTINDVPAAEVPELKKSLTKKHRPISDQTIVDLYVDTLQRLEAERAAQAAAAK